jgi:hypothetical protein
MTIRHPRKPMDKVYTGLLSCTVRARISGTPGKMVICAQRRHGSGRARVESRTGRRPRSRLGRRLVFEYIRERAKVCARIVVAIHGIVLKGEFGRRPHRRCVDHHNERFRGVFVSQEDATVRLAASADRRVDRASVDRLLVGYEARLYNYRDMKRSEVVCVHV